MKTKRQFTFAVVMGMFIGLIALAIIVVLPLSAARRSARLAQTLPLSLESTYVGTARLSWAVPGVYSDTLTMPAGTLPDLGRIDLGFLLHCVQQSLTGYVDLSTTLVFTGEHTIMTTQAITTPLLVGPAVHGLCSGADVLIESERFHYLTGAGQPVMRQFRLTGARVNSTTFTGEYRETLWGYGPQPLTIVGEFDLNFITGVNFAFVHHLYLPLVLRQSS